jgi:predicted ATP-dependent serine protease
VLVPLKTNTGFDAIVSKRGGVMPGTVNMITGESGAGKTTVCANVATYIKEANPGATAGIIQAEMNKLDWYEECADNAMLKQLDVVFLLNLLDAPNFLELVEEALGRWDFVIVDSFEVILEQLREVKGWTGKKAEKELINLLNRVAETGKALFVIQHYTKGGTYAGSTKLKHLTTAMIFVMFDKNNERYVTFTKNRRCGHMVNKRLYFTKSRETGQLVFDQRRFENEEAVAAHIVVERDALNGEGSVFNELHEIMRRNQGSGFSDEENALANNTYMRSIEQGGSLFDLPEQAEDEFEAAQVVEEEQEVAA